MEFLLRAAALSFTLLVSGCGGAVSPPPLFVGHVADLSGPEGGDGESAARGIRLAVQDQVQEAQKNNTRPIHVRHTDTRGQLDAFEAEAVRLVAVNHVPALLGGTTAEQVAALDRAKVPVLALTGARPKGISNLIFFTGLSPEFRGKALARFVMKKWPKSPAAILLDESQPQIVALADAFAAALAETGKHTRPKTWRYGKDAKIEEWGKVLVQEKPALLLVAASPRDLLRILKEWKPASTTLVFGGVADNNRSLLDSSDAEGIFLTTPFVTDAGPSAVKEFTARFRDAFGQEPDAHAALAFDAARLLFTALGKCEDNWTSARIAKELKAIKDYPGLTGPLTFSDDGSLRRPAFVARVENGRLKLVQKMDHK
jgi:branched-chain amino acid transport system substrate-binding protein